MPRPQTHRVADAGLRQPRSLRRGHVDSGSRSVPRRTAMQGRQPSPGRSLAHPSWSVVQGQDRTGRIGELGNLGTDLSRCPRRRSVTAISVRLGCGMFHVKHPGLAAVARPRADPSRPDVSRETSPGLQSSDARQTERQNNGRLPGSPPVGGTDPDTARLLEHRVVRRRRRDATRSARPARACARPAARPALGVGPVLIGRLADHQTATDCEERGAHSAVTAGGPKPRAVTRSMVPRRSPRRGRRSRPTIAGR